MRLAFVASLLVGSVSHGAVLTWLPPLEGAGDAFAFDVSADGSTVVGESGGKPVVWRNGVVSPLAFDTALGTVSVIGLAPDASVFVGRAVPGGGAQTDVIRWIGSGEASKIAGPAITNIAQRSLPIAVDASNEGAVIVGAYPINGSTPARWTRASGWQTLGPEGVVTSGYAQAVSDDGSVIVGQSGAGAFRWTPTGGYQLLPDLPGADGLASANEVSGNGRFVVGESSTARGVEAFVWTEAEGTRSFFDVGPDTSFRELSPTGVTDDGAAVGFSWGNPLGPQAFVWDRTSGVKLLDDLLTPADRGSDPRPLLAQANAVTPDGQTIVGNGRGPDGSAWVLRVLIPEPASALLALAAAIVFARRCRL
jgi:uncharacterized membrane protein